MRKIKVVIDRSKWRTGTESLNKTGEGPTLLLNEEGFMCCLGFCMNASKVAKKDLLGITVPALVLNAKDSEALSRILRSNGVRSLTKKYSKSFDSSNLAADAMIINDSSLPPKEKEQRLLELFKDSVFDIEFTGEYA